MKRIYIIFALLCAMATASAQSSIDSLALRALQVGKVMQQERVYLHFDNTAYYLGETMWFKAYVSFGDNLRPSQLSKVLYVELVAPEGYVVKTNKYKIDDDGCCNGEFELNPLLLSGYYEVRAYTRYMLNWDKSAIFSRVFPVFDKVNADNWDFKNIHDRKRAFMKNGEWVSAELPEASLDFFPESGHLVTGIESRVAYELRGEDGLFGEEKITIYENGTRLLETIPQHMGKGSFSFTPKKNARYSAEVTMTNSKGKAKTHRFDLPEAASEGAVMSVSESGGHISIDISGNLPAEQELGFLILNRGTMGYYRKFSAPEGHHHFTFAKDSLREGVNRAVLFIDSSTPLAERQFFVEHDSIMPNDMSTVKLHVTANGYHVHNASLKPNQKVTLKVSRDDGKPLTAESNISLTVRDAIGDQKTSYSHNMYTYMLLGSELKGYIPDAAQYFDPRNNERKEHLDLVMLTHGWSSYDWKLLSRPKIEKFQVVERGITLKGHFYRKLIDRRFGHGGSFTLIPQKYNLTRMDMSTDNKSIRTSTFRTDSTGLFVIEVPDFYGTTIASLKPQTVMKNSGNNSYHYVLDRYFSPEFRQYDHWERHLGAPMSKSMADSMINLNPFEYMLSPLDVVGKKKRNETYSRPPHSEMRFNYLEEWEYANDITYLNMIDIHKDELYRKVSDEMATWESMHTQDTNSLQLSTKDNFQGGSQNDTLFYPTGDRRFINMPLKSTTKTDYLPETKYLGNLRYSTDGGIETLIDHDYDHILTAEDVVKSAMRRHNYNWAYWVQLMVVLGEYSPDRTPAPDMEYLHGVADAEKMTGFKEFVIRSDEKTRLQFENRLTHWIPLSATLDRKIPLQQFYAGFLSHSYLYAGEGIDGCPDIGTFHNSITPKYGISYPMNPNYVACMIPFTDEEKKNEIVPDYTATSSMRYTSVQGYSESKQFYSPDYSNMKPKEKDYRRTLLWEPAIIIGEGEAVIEFYNSSNCNSITVDVEGRDGSTLFSNGKITRTRVAPLRDEASSRSTSDTAQPQEAPLDSATLAACAYHHEKGLIYYNMRRYKDAITIFAELAQYKYAPSLYYIARCYLDGTGLAKNDQFACKFMLEAASRGEARAQYDLSTMLNEGKIIQKDTIRARQWYMKALENNEPRALMETAHRHRVAGREAEARRLITEAARQQFPEGVYEYGIILINEGKEGIEYIRAAAEMKHNDAINYMIEHEYSSRNYKAAYRFAQELHMLGDHRGTRRMADFYYDGKGIGRDRSTATDLYIKAANAGNEEARKRLKEIRK